VMILSGVFYKAIGKWCIDDDLRNPCVKVERHPCRPRERYITDEEFAGCRAIACPQVQIAMDIAYLTAQRQADIVGMTWKQIEAIGLPREKWGIALQQGKTGKRLRISISPALEAPLKRAKLMLPHWPREYVIRTKWGNRYTGDGFRALWQRTMRVYVKGGGTRFTFHDIRAKSLSDHKDIHRAYSLSGHIDIKMTRRTYDRGVRQVEPLK
jgi:integrase